MKITKDVYENCEAILTRVVDIDKKEDDKSDVVGVNVPLTTIDLLSMMEVENDGSGYYKKLASISFDTCTE